MPEITHEERKFILAHGFRGSRPWFGRPISFRTQVGVLNDSGGQHIAEQNSPFMTEKQKKMRTETHNPF